MSGMRSHAVLLWLADTVISLIGYGLCCRGGSGAGLQAPDLSAAGGAHVDPEARLGPLAHVAVEHEPMAWLGRHLGPGEGVKGYHADGVSLRRRPGGELAAIIDVDAAAFFVVS